MASNPVKISFELKTKASRQQTWEFFSDLYPRRLRLIHDLCLITLTRESTDVLLVRVERSWSPQETLTAGELLQRSHAQELLPPGSVDSAFHADAAHPCVVVVRADDPATVANLEHFVAPFKPRRVHRDREVLLARLEEKATGRGLPGSVPIVAFDSASPAEAG